MDGTAKHPKEIEAQRQKELHEKALHQEQQEQEILKNPKLLQKIIETIQQNGIQGEENTIMVLINKICLRLVKNATPTSGNVLLSDETGSGKDAITKAVCKLFLEEHKNWYHFTRISEHGLDYLCDDEGNFTLDGKVITLEDPPEEQLKSDAFRVATSGENAALTVKDHKKQILKNNGKPIFIITSRRASIDLEGIRRWECIKLDTSTRLTTEIIKQTLEQAEGKTPTQNNTDLEHALKQLLFPSEVIIPYATNIFRFLPKKLVMRTKVKSLLDYIKSSTTLHQYQRQKDEQGRLIANELDYDYGRYVYQQLNQISVPMNIDERKFMAILQEHKEPMKINDISDKYNSHGKKWIYDHLEDFKSKGLIKTSTEFNYEANKEIMMISANEETVLSDNLPTSEEVVLSRFSPGFVGAQQIDVTVLSVFTEILQEIEKRRKNNGYITSLQQNQQNQHNLSYNDITKPEQNQTKPKLQENLQKFKEYIVNNQKAGYKINDDFLQNSTKDYGQTFIDQCIQTGLIIKNGHNEWEWKT